MNYCVICNNKTILGKPISDGIVCNKCAKEIPNIFYPNFYGYNRFDILLIKSLYGKYENFSPTAKYGNLQIDEMHGLFSIKSSGKPAIFNCLELNNFELYCTNPVTDKYNNVFCDVAFSCEFCDSRISIKLVLKRHQKCKSKRLDNDYLSWEQPGDMSLFETLFMKMYDVAVDKYNRSINESILTKQDVDRFKAETLFMIENGYNNEDLLDTKNKLLKIFTKPNQVNKIEQAYRILHE